jgi:acyl-[acyl-carrier-protein]-phospholipid O-acyltransferase/long-chain-fatty-acid--[acyl-carrier-protein] ligase
LYWAIREPFGNQPQQIFYVSSLLMAVGAAYFLWRLRGTGLLIGKQAPLAVPPETHR